MHQDQDNQRNLLVAIVLSVAVLLFWQLFYAGPKMREEQERRQRVQQEQAQPKEQPAAPKPTAPSATQQPSTAAAPSATAPAAPAPTREAALQASPRHPVETPSLKGSIALRGGRIDDLVLVKYHETVDPKSANVVLFSPSGAPHPYYAEYGWVAAGGVALAVPGADTLWTAQSAAPLTPTTPLSLVWDNGQGLIFRRTIAVDANYLFTVTDAVENKSAGEVTLHPYALISRHGMPKTEGFYILHEGPIGELGKAGLQGSSWSHGFGYADLLKPGGSRTYKETGGWLGFTDKYWAAALVPDQKTAYDARFIGTKDTRESFQADLMMAGVPVPPGGRTSSVSNLFAGAKQTTVIDAYQEKLGRSEERRVGNEGRCR